jgi:hypothetical protein
MENNRQAAEIKAMKVFKVQDKWKLDASEAKVRELENQPDWEKYSIQRHT